MNRASSTTPNLIFIHAESMDGRKMGCMGEPSMGRATPNLDRLADDGVLFTNAYTNCPVSNPSRASMWSGKYPHHYDCWNNHEGLRDDVQTFQDVFDRAGYQTDAIGPLDYRWGMHSIRDQVGSWTRAARIMRPTSRTPMPVVRTDGQAYAADWRRTYDAIKRMSEASRSEQPFMLYLTTGLVHPAFIGTPQHMGMVDEDAIDLPPTLGGMEMTSHPVMQYIRATKNCDQPFSEGLVRQIRHIYFGMIAALDEMVGRVLDAVDALGLADNTVVIFSSDHGEMAGEQNQILKRTMYEPSVHVPLIVRGPGLQRGRAVDTPVSLIDLYPTLLDLAGLDYDRLRDTERGPEDLDGESLMPLLCGDSSQHRDWAYSEYHGDRCCTGASMLRRGPWKLVHYACFEPQLFHLDADPWEADDVAGAHPEVVREMEGILAARFDLAGIDARAKAYDREAFVRWSEQAREEGTYQDTMATVYSGFDRQCIENLMPWRDEDEAAIRAWLDATTD